MESKKQTPKEKYDALLKEIRIHKSESSLEAIYQDLNTNKSLLFNNNEIPFQFSNDLLWLLKKYKIKIDTQLNIFKLYIEEFFSMKNKPEDLLKLKFSEEIFKYDSEFYTESSNIENFLVFLNRFFNLYYPKNTSITHKEGDKMDVLISDNSCSDLYGWLQIPIKRIENSLLIFEDPMKDDKEIKISLDSFKVQEKNTFTSDEEILWRENLKDGDKIDFLNLGKNWVESKIINVGISIMEISSIGENNKISSRVVKKLTPAIQPLLKYSYSYNENEINDFAFLEVNNNFQKFNYCIPYNKNNYLIPVDDLKIYSLEYYEILNYFISKLVDSNIFENEKLTIEHLYIILNILNSGSKFINKVFIGEYFRDVIFPCVKKLLINISLDKKQNISKIMIDKILNNIEYYLNFSYYSFQLFKISSDFIINFGYNCFKISENFEKRLLGLNSILNKLNLLSGFKENISNQTLIEITSIINNVLLNNNDGNDLFNLLFNKSDIHEQLLLKGTELILTLSRLKLLIDKDIDRLYNYALSSQKGSDIYISIYKLLNNIAKDLSIEQRKILFDKIINFPFEKIRKDDIDLMIAIIQNINSKDNFRPMAIRFLDYFYNFIFDYKNKESSYLSDFVKILSSAKDLEDKNYLYIYYFDKIVGNLINEENIKSIYFYYYFINEIIWSINDESMMYILQFKFKETFTKEKNSELLISKLVKVLQDWLAGSYDKSIPVDHYLIKILNNLKAILDFIEYQEFFTTDSLLLFCDLFIFADEKSKYQSEFLQDLLFYLKKNLINIKEFCDQFFIKLDKYLDKFTGENEKYRQVDNKFVESILRIHKECNEIFFQKNNNNNNADIGNNENIINKVNPLDTKYFDIIWKMLNKFFYKSLLSEFLKQFTLKDFSAKERYEIWEKIIKKIFTDINENNPVIALNMILTIIKYSEKYGTGGAISHQVENIPKIPIKLKIVNIINATTGDIELTENLYSTSTLYDIKKEIQKKTGIDPILIEFCSILDSTLINDANGKIISNVIQLKTDKTFKNTLKLLKSKEFDLINKVPLLDKDGNLTDKSTAIFAEIYYKYATNGKLDIQDFKHYFKDATLVDINEASVKIGACNNFNKFDNGKKNYWTLEEFIDFHLDALKRGKENSIYINLIHLGYRRDLEHFNSPISKESNIYYEENNVKEYMPRYFIGNSRDYMSKLFKYAKYSDKTIHNLAKNILNEVSTLEEMKNTLFKVDGKIDSILQSPNLELRSYAYNILLAEFEKNEEDKDENNKLATNNFVKNNLCKLVEDLINYSVKNDLKNNENVKEDSEYKVNNLMSFMSYYLTNLQIIYYSFKYAVEDQEIINTIDKYEDLSDENEKNHIKKFKIVLEEQKQKIFLNLNLEKLFNMIVENFALFEDCDIFMKINRSCIRQSLKIAIYIILLSHYLNEENKNSIYKNYISLLLRILQNASFFTKTNIFVMNKLILNLMTDEKEFILFLQENLSKEILDYEKLNKVNGKIQDFFKLFADLIIISIKESENDKLFSMMKELINLITKKDISLNENLLSSYLGLIKLILTTLKNSKYQPLIDYNFESLITEIITDFIITYQNFDKKEKKIRNYSKYCDTDYIDNLFEILSLIISLNPQTYSKLFFDNEDIKNVKQKHLSILEDTKSKYNPKSESKSIAGFVGLKNLSCLCYINSVIQQFYMMPLFKNTILNLPLNPLLKENEDNDDLIFQLQKMFFYLTFSDKEFYNPKSFVFSFKDYDGNPTNINVQCDAQEFLSRLIEKIETGFENTDSKYLCGNILGGTSLQQVICTNPECGNISERKENINYLSLDIKGCKNLYECLDKYIIEEKIEDYHCEKCDKKITNIKKVLIDKLPNILIIHLQRIAFSYETFNMEKINSIVEFEKELNIKKYTTQYDDINSLNEYFDYELTGILIHSGTAQFGHYYSIIYSNKKKENGAWYKFNDTKVEEIKISKAFIDAFGSDNPHNREYGSSAYMLIYEKKIKKPVLLNFKNIDEKIKKLLDDNGNNNSLKLDEEKILDIYENEKDAIEKNIYNDGNLNKEIIIKGSNSIASLMNYDKALENITKLIIEHKEKLPFVRTIMEENIKFCNDKKIYSKAFTKFLYDVINYIKMDICFCFENKAEKINYYIPLLKLINDIILNILSVSDFKEELNFIVDNLTDIYERSASAELITYLIKEIIEPKLEYIFINYFCTRDNYLGNAFSLYIGKILCTSINNKIEIESSMKIIEYYLNKIPVEITKKWTQMEYFNNFILVLIENSDILKKTFIQNGQISKLIDYVMGRSSPIYQGDERTENKANKGKFGPIIKAIAILLKFYIENKKKDENLNLSNVDKKMINCNKFYEKVVLDDYDASACSMLIDYKMQYTLSSINDEKLDGDFDNDIIDILVKLKIPVAKKINDIVSCLELIINLIKKYSEIYINDKEIFNSKLNIFLGIPVPNVNSGNAEIKYLCGKNIEYSSILTNISTLTETNRNMIPLLNSFFTLVNINELVFNYINNLPAFNNLTYSYFYFMVKLFTLTYKENEVSFSINDDMGLKNPLKELLNLVHEVCTKNNVDYNLIENDNKIKPGNSLYFNDFYFNEIQYEKTKNKIQPIEMILTYCSMQKLMKTNLECFDSNTYFATHTKNTFSNNDLVENGLEEHKMFCLVLLCEQNCDFKINFKPYIYSKIEISAKKDQHFIIFCKSYNENEKINFDELNIEIMEDKVFALPSGNEENNFAQVGNDDACVVNCPLCGTSNVLDESNPELKCVFCEASLF